MQSPVLNLNAARAFQLALSRATSGKIQLVTSHPSPEVEKLSQLQQAHADAKARALKIASREPGVCSIYELGEEISRIEDKANAAMERLDIEHGLELHTIVKRLQQLIPHMRTPDAAKPCPHCQAEAAIKTEAGRFYVECSNMIDCPQWPQTKNQLTQAEAIDAWNNKETR